MPPIEHFYILGVVAIYMIIICIAVWRVKDVDIEKDNLEAWLEERDD